LGQEPEHICCRDGHVQVKVDLLLAARLTVGEAGVPEGVSDHWLNLVVQTAVLSHLLGWLGGIGSSKDDLLSARTDQKHNSEIPPKV
jgi:hypothetical protein